MPPRTRRPRIPLEAAKPGVTTGRRASPSDRLRPPDGPSREERKARDDAAEAAGGPRGYSWEQFKPGNIPGNSTHGAGDLTRQYIGKVDPAGVHGLSQEAERRAQVFLAEILESDAFPPWLKAPMFRVKVARWARAHVQNDMVYDYMMRFPEEERYIPQRAGAQKSPHELWMAVDAHELKYLKELGLTPASYAKLRIALGLNRKEEDDAIAGLGKKGARIRKAREAKVIQMHAEDGDERGA